MKITWEIDDDTRLVTLEYRETPSYEEWAKVMEAVLSDRRYGPGFAFLADRRSVAPPTADYLRRVGEFVYEHRARMVGSRWANLVSPAGLAMARRGERLSEALHLPIASFTDRDEALAWLREQDPLVGE